jgi:hypothetical protein
VLLGLPSSGTDDELALPLKRRACRFCTAARRTVELELALVWRVGADIAESECRRKCRRQVSCVRHAIVISHSTAS